MRAIGLDPSLSGFGWAVLSDTGGGNLVRCGVWSTEREAVPGKVAADTSRRIHFMAESTIAVIEAARAEDPEVTVYVEGLGVFGDRFTTAIGQGRLLGIVDGIVCTLRHAYGLELPLIEVPSAEVKKLVPNFTGKRRKVDKTEVAESVFERFPEARGLVNAAVLEFSPKAAEKAALNITDAIAVAVAGMQLARFQAALRPSGSGW